MWLLKSRPVVDADTAAWHVENFEWLVRQFAATDYTSFGPVLPRPGFFVTDGEQGPALAQRIFTQVKHHCGMDDWEVDLVEDDNPLARHDLPRGFGLSRTPGHALGTFGVSGNRIQISYVPALLREPEQLIATFAHELAHYLLATAGEWPICADDEKECLTDLTAVFMGFGVFLANARFRVETYSDGTIQGWSMGRAGYLPEADLIFALALFLRVKGLDADEACGCLKPHLARLLRRAMRQLPVDHADVKRIRAAIPDTDPAPGIEPVERVRGS